jgi:hypothetical protein
MQEGIEFRKRGLPTFAEILDLRQSGWEPTYRQATFCLDFLLLFHHGKSKDARILAIWAESFTLFSLLCSESI